MGGWRGRVKEMGVGGRGEGGRDGAAGGVVASRVLPHPVLSVVLAQNSTAVNLSLTRLFPEVRL